MSQVLKPTRVTGTGHTGYGYGSQFSDPRSTHTRGRGYTGIGTGI
jgi:hypothetical protein